MQLPLTDPDTLFEELLQDLPPETAQMAREFKAFVRAKKVKTPGQLLRAVFLYCGLDKSLREVAGPFTALYESMTDQAVAERLRACGPWGQARLRRLRRQLGDSWGRLDRERVGTWWRVWGMLKDEICT